MAGALIERALRSRARLAFASACLAFAVLAPVAAASDAEGPGQWRGQSETQVTCVKAPGPGSVEISAQGGNGADLRFVRSGDEMVIFEENYLHGIVSCGPGALALDEITEVRLVADDVVYDSSFTIDLSQGPLGPGAGADDAAPEIEFDLPVQTSFNFARFEGVGARPGAIHVGRHGDEAGADLNGDGDVDVRWEGAEYAIVSGTPGDDRIDLSGDHAALGDAYRPYGFSVDAGAGDDEVLLGGGGGYDRYLGGPGDDTFRLGGASEALLDGGEGYDTLVVDPGAVGDALGSLQSIENVVRAGGPAKTTAPAVRILAARIPEALPGLKRRGVSVRVLCSQDCNSRVELSTGRRAVRQGMPWILGARTADLTAGVPAWVRVRLRSLARRALADNRPWRFNVRTWVKATYADGTIRQRWLVSEIG